MQPGFFQGRGGFGEKGTILVSSFRKERVRFYALYLIYIGLFRQCQYISIIDISLNFGAHIFR